MEDNFQNVIIVAMLFLLVHTLTEYSLFQVISEQHSVILQ